MALRLGIIGAGRLGRQHAETAARYGARLVAVHDVLPEAAEALARDFQIPVATSDLAAVFNAGLDAVVIATPPAVRLAPIALACAHRCHLFVEKPPALAVKEGRHCQTLIQQAGVLAAVGFNLRYHPGFERLHQLTRHREIHLVRTVCTIDYYLNYSMPGWFLQKQQSGGPIAEQAIHLLDGVRWLCGNDVAVSAIACGTKNMGREHPEYDAETILQLMYQTRRGVIGTHLNHCGHQRFAFDCEVVGPEFRLALSVGQGTLQGYIGADPIDEPVAPGNKLGLDRLEAWLEAVGTGRRELIRSPWDDSLHTLALVEAARKSQQSKQLEKVEAG